ncbi:MAG: Crp/Fnr family transcriptional regulator [Bryobacterales bacterium]|nr:Crp/Fnr family transcriptional regulator [Bryobacterales bacterium]
MDASTQTAADPLPYLPRSTVANFKKGQAIYDETSPNRHLHLILKGAVKIVQHTSDAAVVLNLFHAEELFGERALAGMAGERAVALEDTTIMSWTADTVSALAAQHPELASALLQRLAVRCVSLQDRIATLCADSAIRRLAKALISLSMQLGKHDETTPEVHRLPPLPHLMLAQYVGTTREAVTNMMNLFRRQGLIDYTRRDVVVRTASLRDWLNSNEAD